MLGSGVQNLGVYDYMSDSFYTLKEPIPGSVHMLNLPGCGDDQASSSFSDAVMLEKIVVASCL
jgi:hypothetical protein